MAEEVKNNVSSKDENVAMAVVAYFIFFLPLLTDDKNDPFVKFHVKQSIVLLVAAVIVWFLGRFIPYIGWDIIGPIGGLVVFVLWLIGVINAASKKQQPVPLIGKFADMIKF